MVRIRRASVVALLATLLAACGATTASQPNATNAPAASEKLSVIATYSILGDMVQNVAGDLVDLTVLVGPNGDAHSYEPTPGDSAMLANANVVFENGLEFESWLDDLYTASGSNATRVAASDGISPLSAPEEGKHDQEHAEGEQHAEDEHSHGEYDPHVWHAVSNAIIMVENVRDALVTADTANAAAYQANATTYLAQLTELDTFVKDTVAQLPAERRKLVTTHDTFGYFANAYGFEIVATALGSVSTEVADPSAGEIGEVVNEVKAAGVPAIFIENVSNNQVTETIANEAGVDIAPELYTDALGEPGSDGATYIQMMRYNVVTIVDALKG